MPTTKFQLFFIQPFVRFIFGVIFRVKTKIDTDVDVESTELNWDSN